MELQSDKSKKDIADALISLMKKKDFNKITNKDITNRAGLSHITIYRNFKNKDEKAVYIDEAIELSKIYCDEKAPAFVNSILDKVWYGSILYSK